MSQTTDGSVYGEWEARVPPQVTVQKVLAVVAICCAVLGFYALIRRCIKKHFAQDQGRSVEIQLPQSRFGDLANCNGTDCAVCLDAFVAGTETVAVLPGCNHVFHPHCIRDWIVECSRQSSSVPTCPLCRIDYQAATV